MLSNIIEFENSFPKPQLIVPVLEARSPMLMMNRLSAHLLGSLILALSSSMGMAADNKPIRLAPIVVTDATDDLATERGDLDLGSLRTVGEPVLGLAALANVSPAVDISTSGARGYGDVTTSRGFANTPFFGDPALQYYVDGLPMGSAFTQATALPFVGSARFLDPTEAFLAGDVTPGGVVILETRDANDLDGVSGQWRGELTDNGGRAGAFWMGTPVGNERRGAFAVSGFIEERDGFVDNPNLGTRPDSTEALGARIKASAPLQQGLSVGVSAFFERYADGVQPLTPLSLPPFQTNTSRDGETNVSLDGVAISIRGEGPVTFAATTGYRVWDLSPLDSQLNFGGGAIIDNRIFQREERWTQEVSLSRYSGAISWGVTAFAGLTDADGRSVRESTFAVPETSRFSLERTDLALAGVARVALRDDLALEAGLRIDHSEQDLDRRELLPASLRQQFSRSDSAVQPMLRAEWTPADTVTVAGAVTRTFKAGGFSTFTAKEAFIPHEDETGWTASLDVGWTTERLAIGATAFVTWVDGYQLERSFLVDPNPFISDYFVANADEAKTVGLELSAQWQSAERLALNLSAMVARSTFEEFITPDGLDASGNATPFTPAWTLSASARWELLPKWTADLAIAARGETYFDELETRSFRADSYVTADAGISYTTGAFTATAFIRNAFDEEYLSYINAGIGQGAYGDPRVVGARLTIDW